MINFIETLFGVAATSFVAALFLLWRGSRKNMRLMGALGGAALLLALILELYVRM